MLRVPVNSLPLHFVATVDKSAQKGESCKMNETNSRDHLLNGAIKEYRRMAEGAKADAAKCLDAEKEHYLALSKSLVGLADALQGRAISLPSQL
jgi:hypothetical protein